MGEYQGPDATIATLPDAQPNGNPAGRLRELLRNNHETGRGGTYAVCSSHPVVLEAAARQALENGSVLHVESTSSQVNQFGGYSGLTPRAYAQSIRAIAKAAGLPPDRILLGGDHLGPFAWRNEASASALKKACDLVHDCVLAGYRKIHLDASMSCASDLEPLPEQTIADRAAILCQAAELAHRELPAGSPEPVYVVGTEVPAPGGESSNSHGPAATKAEDVHRTLETFRAAFADLSLSYAWERVIALVVQPGVEFGSNTIFDYDRGKAQSLSAALNQHAGLVFEAHSTDYQTAEALAQLVEDHFAILKVGPWLTFAFREAALALGAMERELLQARAGRRVSQVREALDAAMQADPSYWRSYYQGDEHEVRRERIFSLSDRCRYYWNEPTVQMEVARLFDNLEAEPIPLTLVSQFLPQAYEAIRSGEPLASPQQLAQHHIRQVLRMYANACSSTRPA